MAQTGHKKHPAIGQSLIPLVVHIAAVKDQDGAWSKLKFACHFHLRGFPFGEDRIAREMSIMVQNRLACWYWAQSNMVAQRSMIVPHMLSRGLEKRQRCRGPAACWQRANKTPKTL